MRRYKASFDVSLHFDAENDRCAKQWMELKMQILKDHTRVMYEYLRVKEITDEATR